MKKITILDPYQRPVKKRKLNIPVSNEVPEDFLGEIPQLPVDVLKAIFSFLSLFFARKLSAASKYIRKIVLTNELRIEALEFPIPCLFENELFLNLIADSANYRKLFRVVKSVNLALKKNQSTQFFIRNLSLKILDEDSVDASIDNLLTYNQNKVNAISDWSLLKVLWIFFHVANVLDFPLKNKLWQNLLNNFLSERYLYEASQLVDSKKKNNIVKIMVCLKVIDIEHKLLADKNEWSSFLAYLNNNSFFNKNLFHKILVKELNSTVYERWCDLLSEEGKGEGNDFWSRVGLIISKQATCKISVLEKILQKLDGLFIFHKPLVEIFLTHNREAEAIFNCLAAWLPILDIGMVVENILFLVGKPKFLKKYPESKFYKISILFI